MSHMATVIRVSDRTRGADDEHGSRLAAPDPVPRANRYEEIAAQIEADIKAERLAPGTRLRSERELASEYGVAYVTLRKAMQILRDRGVVETVHGRGTYVK